MEMKAEEILAKVYGCKDVEELKKDFAFDTRSVKMIVEAMEEYAAQSPQEGGTVEGAGEVLDRIIILPDYIKEDILKAMTEYASQVSATDKERITFTIEQLDKVTWEKQEVERELIEAKLEVERLRETLRILFMLTTLDNEVLDGFRSREIIAELKSITKWEPRKANNNL
jgi:hypothetical protein